MKTLRTLFALALFATSLGLFGLEDAARAQTIEFSTAPTTLAVGTNGELWLRANLPSGTYTGLTVDLEFPVPGVDLPEVTFVNATAGTASEFSWTWLNTTTPKKLRFTQTGATLDISTASANRQFLVVISAPSWRTFANTPFTFTARFSGSRNGTAFDESAEHTVTATRAVPGFAATSSAYSGGAHLNPTVADGHADRVGIRSGYQVSVGNSSYDWLGPLTWRVTLPAGSRYVGVEARDYLGNGTIPVVVEDAPSPYVLLTQPTTFTVRTAEIGWHQLPYNTAQIHLYVSTFTPCGSLPVASPPSVSATADVTTRPYLGELETYARTFPARPLAGLGAACGSGGGFSVGYSSTEAAGYSGTQSDWRPRLDLPVGATGLVEGMVVQLLPPETSYVEVTNGSIHWPGWDFLACDFSGLTFASGSWQLSVAELHTHRADRCTTNGWRAGATHYIRYAAGLDLENRTVFLDNQGMYVYIPLDWRDRHGLTLTLPGYAVGTFSAPIGAFGDTIIAPATDIWEDTRSYALPTDMVPWSQITLQGSALLDSNGGAAGTTQFDMTSRWSGIPPLNSTTSLNLPEGLLATALPTWVTPTCTVPADKMVWPQLSDRPLVFRFGTPANPFTGSPYCFRNYTLRQFISVDPTYPFFHLQPLTITTTHSAENQTSQGTSASWTVRVIVAAGQDARLSVSCDESGYPVYDALAVNRGRDPIADGVLRFVVPDGTDVLAVVPNDAVPGSGAGLEVSTDGGTTWEADTGDYQGVTDIRLVGIAIAGGDVDNMPPRPGFTVTLDPGASPGTIEGELTMSSPDLGTTPPKIVPFEVGLCPGVVDLQVFYDADGDGQRAQDGSEDVGAGHRVKLLPQAGSPSGEATAEALTDEFGWVQLADVVPGEYDVVYVGSPAGPATFSVATPATVSLQNAGAASAELGLGCECADPTPDDTCSNAECNPQGECQQIDEAYGEPCDDGQADPTCHGDMCDGAGTCMPIPVETGTTCTNPEPDNPCVVGGECDGAGACMPVAELDGVSCGDSTDCMDVVCDGGVCSERYDDYQGTWCEDPSPDNPCTFGACDGFGGCATIFEDDGWACDDPNPDNPCDEGACFSGSCEAAPAREGESCADPDPDNPCDEGLCEAGACVAAPANDGMSCADPEIDNPCRDGQCDGGSCVPVDVNEGETCAETTADAPCMVGLCSAGECGATPVADGTPCVLDDACVASAECQSGGCTVATEVSCDDGDRCTTDICDPAFGCDTEPVPCEQVAVSIPLVDEVGGAARGHVVCRVTPSTTGGPGTLSCDVSDGVLVEHNGAGECGLP